MRRPKGTVAMLVLLCLLGGGCAGIRLPKQQALDEWRRLTATNAPSPRVFVKGDQIRFYFRTSDSVEEFSARWGRHRIPSESYRVNSAVLRWNQKLQRMPVGARGWREATVIAGAEWMQLATNLVEVLAPASPGHGIYYQGFLADRLLYRDAQSKARFASLEEEVKGIVVDQRLSIEETLAMLANLVDQRLMQRYPGERLFLLMAPGARRFPQALLLDRQKRECASLVPAAFYDTTEQGLSLSTTAQGVSAAVLEGHGLALLKNPVSSLARLGDLGVQTALRFLRFPFPKPTSQYPPIAQRPGMDLDQWDAWLDRYTGTHQHEARLDLLIDGERFFPRLRQAIAAATNDINFEMYIIDRDDVGVGVADQLKERSREIPVKVILDRLGSIGGGAIPPATPLPERFVPPASICAYLKQDSSVQVRPFLNPWFSTDHSKVLLIDGTHAWIGGMNFGREYRYEWHDVMVELQGPVVGALEEEFRRHWAHEGLLGDLAYLAELTRRPQKTQRAADAEQWAKVRLLPTKTAWKPFKAAVLNSIAQSKNYAFVENPYLFDKRVILALVRARNRGVDVRVVLPRENDIKSGARSNLVLANYFLEHGVRVYFFPGMTHVKALMVDDWVCIGSANLNHVSLRLCQEQNIATSNPAFAARVKRELFEEDFSRSYELKEPVSVDWVDFLADLLLEGV